MGRRGKTDNPESLKEAEPASGGGDAAQRARGTARTSGGGKREAGRTAAGTSATKPAAGKVAARRAATKRVPAKLAAKPSAAKAAEAPVAPKPAGRVAAKPPGGNPAPGKPGVRESATGPDAPPLPGWLTVVGATQNNLKGVTVGFPLGRFVCVTGVSGSGKSSLVNDVLCETLLRDLNGATGTMPGACRRIDGTEHLDKVIAIDQTPIGRTPRSNPATYIKLFDLIRDLYAALPDAKVRGYTKSRFSFNVASGERGGGRCEACEGNGSNRLDMDFLADVWVTCPVCEGKRFSRETLHVLYKGRSIADVLDMDVQQALEHFAHQPKIAAMLQTFHDVGLDYVKLGQPSPTLSGGEAQRIKLARELVKVATGRTLYILDEPTTGLHFEDVRKLLEVLHRLVDAGNTVVVVEHHLDVVKTADWVIDLGPEGGEDGGGIVAEGTPEEVAKTEGSHTGEVLRRVLNVELRSANNEMPAGTGSSSTSGGRRRKRAAAGKIASDVHSSHAMRGSQYGDVIRVRGASEHNLKHVNVDVPHRAMTVCCGPSGSGKTSFAIDTLYVEGQRRYIESLSAYARQFLGQMQKPRVEHIDGLAPAICIEQKSAGRSPRSTAGTVTEIYDYLRVLWARLAEGYCPNCDVPVGTQTSDQIVERILALGDGAAVTLLSPIEPEGQETYAQLLERERKQGYARVRLDGRIVSLDAAPEVDARGAHRVELVIDRLTIRAAQRTRLAESVEHALSRGEGVMLVTIASSPRDESISPGSDEGSGPRPRELRFSQHRACEECGESFEELTPHHFSFNSRLGWCEICEGLGVQKGANPSAIITNPRRSILDGAVAGWGRIPRGSMLHRLVCAVAGTIGFDPAVAWADLEEGHRRTFLHGAGDRWIEVNAGLRIRWRGFYPAIHRATLANWVYRQRLGEMAVDVPCEACAGSRLRPDARAARFRGRRLSEVCAMPMSEALAWFEGLRLDAREKRVAGDLVDEVRSRLRFLVDVGLDYVSLDRSAPTLSGGESQRIRLASQLGTGLTGVLYVLDEPTIGLHPRDNARLIRALHKLRDLGNTLLVVEHDREVIDAADRVLDFGPGAGALGGRIVADAPPKRLRDLEDSLTGRYLANTCSIPAPTNRRPVRTDGTDAKDLKWLRVHGARENNLKGIDVAFPLGRFTCVTGVSGSGKSSLVTDIVYHALASRLHGERVGVGAHDRIEGLDRIAKAVNVDQSPIGVTPTSTPATYTGVFDIIRELFARLPDAKVRGYTPGRFSFNAPGGRCETCEGMGQRRIEMHFLPDVWVECDNCRGTRYQSQTLEVRFRGRSIADVLTMTVAQAIELFESVPKVRRTLQMLDDVGLGYLPLGQSAATLSGGEAQRIKLATELARPSTGQTVYVLDEPTTGLHFDDIQKLLNVLHRLVDLGNTILCIEHNLDVIKTCDWVIDLGPEAGEGGGRIVVEGSPETVAACEASHTGRALRPVLDAGPRAPRPVWDEAKQKLAESELRKAVRVQETAHAPWQTDGRKWHLKDRIAASPKKVYWDPDVIEWIVGAIEEVEGFAPSDWNDRARIEIRSPQKEVTWFCHLLTGGQDLIDVNLRVPDGTFREAELNRRLGLKTLDERTDLPIYGRWPRVNIRKAQAGWEHVRILPCDMRDIDKRTWKTFLREAAAAYLSAAGAPVGGAGASDENGGGVPARCSHVDGSTDPRQRHLRQLGLSRNTPAKWKPDTLLWLIGQFQKLDRALNVDWRKRGAVVLRRESEGVPSVRIVTNSARALVVEMSAPNGALTPTQVENLGRTPKILAKGEMSLLKFNVCLPEDVPVRRLGAVWQAATGTGESRSGARSRVEYQEEDVSA